MIGGDRLLPKLESDRLKLNMAKRFEFTVPPPGEWTNLRDLADPDWASYEEAVSQVKELGDSQRIEERASLLSTALTLFAELRREDATGTCTGLCPELWSEQLDGLIRLCKNYMRELRGLPMKSESDGRDEPAHPWFPKL